MGELLRSKGFAWVATTNFVMGGWQTAGNIMRIEGEGPWMCEQRDQWEGKPQEELVLADMRQENGEEYPHGDRRQELVFNGVGLKHAVIQKLLDACLLTDEEMEMGAERWEGELVEVDKIDLMLEEEEEYEEVEEEEEEGEGEEEDEEAKDTTNEKTNGSTDSAPKRKVNDQAEVAEEAPPSKKTEKQRSCHLNSFRENGLIWRM